MIQLSPYGQRVVLRINLIGMWIAVLVSIRNFFVCYRQYSKTRGKIHLVNMAQVIVLCVHRFLYGIIPLFEISTCAYFPLLVSFWHITYILFYIVMFMRLIILELDRYSRWIKAIGVLLIGLRFADWPYELAFISIQQAIMAQSPNNGATCWAIWGKGVIILNFVSDSLANLFLSGMFIRRLFVHINHSKTLSSPHSQLIEKIARKSLLCFAFTFVVNLTMNLLKVTMFLGTESDAFTVYFQLIESTLLIEALRNDSVMKAESNALICESCHKELSRSAGQNGFSDDNSDLNNQIIAGTFREHNKIMDQRQDSDIENIKDGSKNYNITPAESAILSQRQPPTEEQPYPSPFPTSLAPRPYTSQSKETSTTSASFINETFLMTNFVKDKSLFPPRITGSENSSSSSHSSRRIDRFNPI